MTGWESVCMIVQRQIGSPTAWFKAESKYGNLCVVRMMRSLRASPLCYGYLLWLVEAMRCATHAQHAARAVAFAEPNDTF
eukprot:5898609-Pleurochrysis_carterae.AAC.1